VSSFRHGDLNASATCLHYRTCRGPCLYVEYRSLGASSFWRGDLNASAACLHYRTCPGPVCMLSIGASGRPLFGVVI
jgi:hypothetical protein